MLENPIQSATKTLNQHLTGWKDAIVSNIIASGQQATGKTARSFEVIMGETFGKIEANRFYKVLETGRKPGKMPPPKSLYEWLEVRFPSVFMSPKRNAVQSLAYIIARKIGKEGSVLYRAGGRKDIFSNELSDENINKCISDIGNVVFTQVFNNINIIQNENS